MSKLTTQHIADAAVTNDKLGPDAVDAAKLDLTDDYPLTGTLDLTGATAVSVPTPSADAEAAPKSYVDNVAAGLNWKDSARVRAQGDITVSAPGANIDSIAMAVDQRVLMDQQGTPTEDGIYLWKGAAVPMVRAADAQVGDEFKSVALFIEEGTDADKAMVCTNDTGSDVIGTDNLAFTTFSGGAVAHALGGAVHSADTLANLNSKISDGTVIDKDTANTFTEKQTLTSGDAADAPVKVVPMASAPSSLADGDIWTLTAGGIFGQSNSTIKKLDNIIISEMHKVTSGEVTAGFFSLAIIPFSAMPVIRATIVGGILQVSKGEVGATGVTPDFDLLNDDEFHFNNNGAATGLSEDIVVDDVLVISYQF